jgi:hypothetical protein
MTSPALRDPRRSSIATQLLLWSYLGIAAAWCLGGLTVLALDSCSSDPVYASRGER